MGKGGKGRVKGRENFASREKSQHISAADAS